MREHSCAVTNASRTVIACIAYIHIYNVKRLGGVSSELNHLEAGARFVFLVQRSSQSACNYKFLISMIFSAPMSVSHGSSIISGGTMARA